MQGWYYLSQLRMQGTLVIVFTMLVLFRNDNAASRKHLSLECVSTLSLRQYFQQQRVAHLLDTVRLGHRVKVLNHVIHAHFL